MVEVMRVRVVVDDGGNDAEGDENGNNENDDNFMMLMKMVLWWHKECLRIRERSEVNMLTGKCIHLHRRYHVRSAFQHWSLNVVAVEVNILNKDDSLK